MTNRAALRAIAAFGLFALAGCTTGDPITAPVGKPPYAYRIGAGDVLKIEVYDEKELQKEEVVTPDGNVTFPLVGTVHVMDLSLSDTADLLARALVKSGRFSDPKLVNLSVALKESKSAQIQVLGEVGKQGSVAFRDRISVVDAIGAVGGLNFATAKIEDVRVIRGALSNPAYIRVDLEEVFVARERDVYLAPGDIVIVPAKWVTRMDRYVQQVLSPLNSMVGTARSGASAAVGAP
jgi:polysaccharide export outer membrane protein